MYTLNWIPTFIENDITYHFRDNFGFLFKFIYIIFMTVLNGEKDAHGGFYVKGPAAELGRSYEVWKGLQSSDAIEVMTRSEYSHKSHFFKVPLNHIHLFLEYFG